MVLEGKRKRYHPLFVSAPWAHSVAFYRDGLARRLKGLGHEILKPVIKVHR